MVVAIARGGNSSVGSQEEGVRDSLAGQRGLQACATELGKYKACMVKQGADKALKVVRAPEVYLEELKQSQ